MAYNPRIVPFSPCRTYLMYLLYRVLGNWRILKITIFLNFKLQLFFCATSENIKEERSTENYFSLDR